jgi:hypothetical protein
MKVINIKRPIIQKVGAVSYHNGIPKHRVLVVLLRSGEKYLLDLSGSQFGWPEVLAPSAQWLALRSEGDMVTKPYVKISLPHRSNTTLREMPFHTITRDASDKLMATMASDIQDMINRMQNYSSFADLLGESDEVIYQRNEQDLIVLFNSRIKTMISDQYRSENYRLFLTGSPDFSPFCPGEQARAVRDSKSAASPSPAPSSFPFPLPLPLSPFHSHQETSRATIHKHAATKSISFALPKSPRLKTFFIEPRPNNQPLTL